MDKDADISIEELKAKIYGMQNDFKEYKKRADENVKRNEKKTKKDFVKKLLTTLDVIDRAGLEIINRDLLDTYSITPIIPRYGEIFNENMHTAIGVIYSNNCPENMVIRQIRKGYVFDGEVIRPAEVMVAHNKKMQTNEKTNETKKQKGILFRIREFMFSLIFKEKTDALKNRENVVIENEIKLEIKEAELKDNAGWVKEMKNKIMEKEKCVEEKEVMLREHSEESIIRMLKNISSGENELKEKEENLKAREEHLMNELKEKEENLKAREENLMIKEKEIEEKLAKIAEVYEEGIGEEIGKEQKPGFTG